MPLTGFIDDSGNTVPFSRLNWQDVPQVWSIPAPLLRSLTRQKRKYCDISVTQLVGPPQVRVLQQRHEYAVRPEELIWSAFGKSLHHLLELRSEPAAIAEECFVARLEVRVGGKRRTVSVGGIPDHFLPEQGIVTNFKSSTTFKACKLHGSIENEGCDWIAAENCYGYLLRRYGFEVKQLQVCLLLKDWSARERDQAGEKFHCSKCKRNHLRTSKPGIEHAEFEVGGVWYPPSPVQTFQLPVWNQQQAEQYVFERVQLHLAAESLADERLPFCTEKETWGGVRCQRFCEVRSLCHQHR